MAQVTWKGSLASGAGTVDAESKAFKGLPISWKARTEGEGGQTTPEELLAAAHASCFAMALSAQLSERGARPESLEVRAAVAFGQRDGGWKILSSVLTVQGKVKGIDEAGFRAAAEAAKEGCPVSQALKGNLELSVEAHLENG